MPVKKTTRAKPGPRRNGAAPKAPSQAKPDPVALAGPKLRALRETSGWTVDEIADRTGVPLKVLTAFEQGDSAAADKLTLPDLERLASACCCSLDDLGGPELISRSRRAPARRLELGSVLSYDPNNW
jgi:transcriptional regulator with XRE-family HTH domain